MGDSSMQISFKRGDFKEISRLRVKGKKTEDQKKRHRIQQKYDDTLRNEFLNFNDGYTLTRGGAGKRK